MRLRAQLTSIQLPYYLLPYAPRLLSQDAPCAHGVGVRRKSLRVAPNNISGVAHLGAGADFYDTYPIIRIIQKTSDIFYCTILYRKYRIGA